LQSGPRSGMIHAEGALGRREIRIAPSILAADFGILAEQVSEAEHAGADLIHVDVMDGHYVPSITLGPIVVAAVRRATQLPLDVHLMIEAPEQYLADFASAGANQITVHAETCPHLHSTLQQLKELGCGTGVALNPSTPAVVLEEVVPFLDLVLVMTVNPGFGGQRFIGEMLPKIVRVRSLLDAGGSEADLEVDGGIDATTAPAVVNAGANVLVAGSAVFGAREGIGRAIERLRKAAADNHKASAG
jgi:ribulose-phosphate 3-epimerase